MGGSYEYNDISKGYCLIAIGVKRTASLHMMLTATCSSSLHSLSKLLSRFNFRKVQGMQRNKQTNIVGICANLFRKPNIYTEILNTCFSIPCRETIMQEGYVVVNIKETLQCEWASLLLFAWCHYMIYISLADAAVNPCNWLWRAAA